MALTQEVSPLIEASSYDATFRDGLNLSIQSESYDYPRPTTGSEYFPSFYLRPSVALPNGEGATYARVYHGSDPQNAVANKIEVDQMVELGDDEEFSSQEFVPYFDTSFVLEIGDDRGPLGVLRIIPYSKETGLKTFNDLSAVTKDSYEHIESTFLRESGCEDMEKVWDVTTLALAPEAQTSMFEKKLIIHNLLVALMDVGYERVAAGELTHLVSENEPKMHRALLRMGYPLEDINGYGDLYYDIANRGKAMTCHPAYFSAHKLLENIMEADSDKLEHLSFAVDSLRVFRQAKA